MGQRIIQIKDAPLPTPDPWGADLPDMLRCPACGLPDPGRVRCQHCGEPLQRKLRLRKPITAKLANLMVILIGRGPILLTIGFLYRPNTAPLINLWTMILTLQIPLFWFCAGGLVVLRWRWVWFFTGLLALLDLLVEIGLQFILQGNPVVPIAAILTDLMVLGILITVYDEVRIETAMIGMPPDHALPKTAQGAYNLGVEYSQVGQWYFAARLWQRAVAFEHTDGRYRRALGTAYLRLKLYAVAQQELAAAHWLMPDDMQTQQLLRMLERSQEKSVD